jgi:hypothetical protein
MRSTGIVTRTTRTAPESPSQTPSPSRLLPKPCFFSVCVLGLG